MMEIQIGNVNFQPTKTGKDKWVVATNEGNLSVWEGKIAEELNKLIGQKVNVEVRQPAPNTNYLPTITGMVSADAGQVLKEVQNGVRSLNGQEQDIPVTKEIRENIRRSNLPEPTDKDKSIIAQCLVKAVIGTWGGKGLEIPEAVEMYHKALELIG